MGSPPKQSSLLTIAETGRMCDSMLGKVDSRPGADVFGFSARHEGAGDGRVKTWHGGG